MSWQKTMFQSESVTAKGDPGAKRHRGPDDTDLFRRFFEGDDTALVRLFDRHNHRLYIYCLQFVNDPFQAEDITQELWERLIRLRTEQREVSMQNPMGLLLKIARNLSIDMLRKNRHHADLESLPEAHHPVADSPELSHLEELVIIALRHLPLAQREVLTLNAYAGYRLDEIAHMLGEPEGAIRTRAWRARAHLGRIISAMIGLDDDNLASGGSDLPGVIQ